MVRGQGRDRADSAVQAARDLVLREHRVKMAREARAVEMADDQIQVATEANQNVLADQMPNDANYPVFQVNKPCFAFRSRAFCCACRAHRGSNCQCFYK